MSHIRSRFDQPAADSVTTYTSSLVFDHHLYPEDILGSIAHARMLGRQGIITQHESQLIQEGLEQIEHELSRGEFVFKPELEDIHMAIEARLFEIKGDVAGKLHTGRSRNDQVALDMRMYTKRRIDAVCMLIKALQKVLLDAAENNLEVIMPGCTHLQHAQPVLLSHHLMAHFEMLSRDGDRLADCRKRADVLPLGSGALAGTSFKIDRQFLADELGFNCISANSIDAVSDRDYLIEFHACASILMMHLSRLAEEIILWSTQEYGFVDLDEAYSTGSSIMPQKKNPDVAELARGKTGRVYGHLVAALTVMKALPLSYNRDLQEDKEGLFDTVNTLTSSLEVMAGMLETMHFNTDAMVRAAAEGYTLATDIADYLVVKGLSFRQSHRITGQLVKWAAGSNRTLESLTLEEYRVFSPLFGPDIKEITLKSSIDSRDIAGGTATMQVARAIKHARAKLNN